MPNCSMTVLTNTNYMSSQIARDSYSLSIHMPYATIAAAKAFQGTSG